MIIEIPEEKLCPKCNTVKPVSEFNKNATQRDGLQYACRDCSKVYEPSRQNLRLAGTEKACENCGRVLPREAFSYHQHSPDRLRAACVTCRQWRKGTPTPEQVESFEKDMRKIYEECQKEFPDIEKFRFQFERSVYRMMADRGLLLNWKPPIWMHANSME